MRCLHSYKHFNLPQLDDASVITDKEVIIRKVASSFQNVLSSSKLTSTASLLVLVSNGNDFQRCFQPP